MEAGNCAGVVYDDAGKVLVVKSVERYCEVRIIELGVVSRPLVQAGYLDCCLGRLIVVLTCAVQGARGC